ncbi:MAG TPA: PHP domain-containing protein [Chthonomonadaceae bacterium]|nr:PHP domain-containing protein [Chthonomonadaceae bacterium]
MPERTIDLHAHTTASDGDQTPTELVRRAAEIGLTAIAVTDHDTTAGVAEALVAGKQYGIEVVPGIELSAEIEKGQCHMLGYLIDPQDATLLRRLEEVLDNRDARNEKIVGKLQALGCAITLDEVREIAGGEVVARPHFARVLLNKGYVGSMQEAFDVYLAKGAKAYVDRVRLSPEECIALVHGAGGVAVLAHPNNLQSDAAETEAEIARLQALGLDGIEARYSQHTPEDTARYLALADRLGLLTTGGSDFHGPSVKPTVLLGHVEGDLPAPTALLDALKAKQAGH